MERAGADVVHWTQFPDHHEPTLGELNEAITSACGMEAEAIVVTEKDAVKLPPVMRPLPFFSLAPTEITQGACAYGLCVSSPGPSLPAANTLTIPRLYSS